MLLYYIQTSSFYIRKTEWDLRDRRGSILMLLWLLKYSIIVGFLVSFLEQRKVSQQQQESAGNRNCCAWGQSSAVWFSWTTISNTWKHEQQTAEIKQLQRSRFREKAVQRNNDRNTSRMKRKKVWYTLPRIGYGRETFRFNGNLNDWIVKLMGGCDLCYFTYIRGF